MVAAAATTFVVFPVTTVSAAADPQVGSLRMYLSSMSWPVRASLARAVSVGWDIDGFISPGDPPFLRMVAGNCRNLRDVEARGRLLRLIAPPQLAANHHSLSASYSTLRARCKEARLTALAVGAARDRFDRTGAVADKAAWQRADAAARKSLPRFSRTTLRSFTQAVHAWRASVVRYAMTLGIPPPLWVKELQPSPNPFAGIRGSA